MDWFTFIGGIVIGFLIGKYIKIPQNLGQGLQDQGENNAGHQNTSSDI